MQKRKKVKYIKRKKEEDKQTRKDLRIQQEARKKKYTRI